MVLIKLNTFAAPWNTARHHKRDQFAHLTSRAEPFDDDSDKRDSLRFGLLQTEVGRQDIYKLHSENQLPSEAPNIPDSA